MTEPKRLLEDANLPEEAAALLRALSVPEAPSAARQAQLAQRWATLTGPATATALGTALWLKAAVLVGLLGLAGIWASVSLRAHDASAPQRAPLASTTPMLSPTPAASPEAALETAAPARAEVTPAPASAPRVKAPARDSLADEEALLEQARRAASSSPGHALGLLQQYQRRFPAGQLTAERMFLSVDVLTRLGNSAGARKQADALMRAFPSSVYAVQVKGQSSNPGK